VLYKLPTNTCQLDTLLNTCIYCQWSFSGCCYCFFCRPQNRAAVDLQSQVLTWSIR